MSSSRKSESGSALLLVLVITPVLLLVLLSVSIVVTAEVRVAALDRDLKAARYVAEHGYGGLFLFQLNYDAMDSTSMLKAVGSALRELEEK